MPDQFLHGVEVVQIDTGLRPIRTAKSSIIGFVGTAPAADVTEFPEDTAVLVKGPIHAGLLGVTGTLKDAYLAAYNQGVSAIVVVRVAEGVDAATTMASVIGDATQGTGCYALLTAGSVTGQEPRIIAAPGHTAPADPATKSPVAAVLETVADRLRAICIVDGPNTNEADALTYKGTFGGKRTYMVDPYVKVFDTDTASYVTQPASGFVAGVISNSDNTRGYWWSPSNVELKGVTGTARPISFNLSSTETEANRLNEGEVATIVRQDGFRLWGNRGTSADALWAFISVVRTNDLIADSIARAHLWAMDRPFSTQLVKDIQDSVQAYLDRLTSLGAILGGAVWLDPELNSETELKAGKLYLNYDIEPPAPLEHLIFRAHRNGSYYDDLIAEVATAA